MNEPLPLGKTTFQQLIPGFLLVGLLLLSYTVLREFLRPLIWALILAYVTWPPYRKLRSLLKGNANASAALMTLIIAVIIFMALFWLAGLLRDELRNAYHLLTEHFSEAPPTLPDFLFAIPWLGKYLQGWVDQLDGDPAGLSSNITEWGKQWLGEVAAFLGDIGQLTLKLAVVLVTVFFCFRDGEAASRQLQCGLVRFLGKHPNLYLQAAGNTTKAVVYGLVLAALAQGMLAGLGYAVAGVQAPVLFGAVTALLAIVPLGATLVWIPIGVTLVLKGALWEGTGLLLWGFLAVSTVDNVIRPLVISGASRVPFLAVMFGILGGLSAFGPIGLFIGPVILAVMLAVWQAWLEQQTEEDSQESADADLPHNSENLHDSRSDDNPAKGRWNDGRV